MLLLLRAVHHFLPRNIMREADSHEEPSKSLSQMFFVRRQESQSFFQSLGMFFDDLSRSGVHLMEVHDAEWQIRVASRRFVEQVISWEVAAAKRLTNLAAPVLARFLSRIDECPKLPPGTKENAAYFTGGKIAGLRHHNHAQGLKMHILSGCPGCGGFLWQREFYVLQEIALLQGVALDYSPTRIRSVDLVLS